MLAAVAAALTAAVVAPAVVLAVEDPVVSIDGTICYEGIGNDGKPYVTLKLSHATKGDVLVVIHTEDGTARSPGDYLGFDKLQVRIPAGQVRAEVTLKIVADREKEPDEYFLVVIDSAVGAKIGNGKAEVIIKDGEPPKEEKPRQ